MKDSAEAQVAHDNQVREEMIPLPAELQERKNASPILSDKMQQSLDVLANWWAVYGQIYRDDPAAELLVAFREILSPLLSKPEILHKAMLIAAQQAPEFRPKPGRIYEIAQSLLAKNQTGNRPEWLDEPTLTQAERDEALEETKEQREALKRSFR